MASDIDRVVRTQIASGEAIPLPEIIDSESTTWVNRMTFRRPSFDD